MDKDPEFAILDLFSGAGGMALGFEAAGGRTVGAVEIDGASARTFSEMFTSDQPRVFGGSDKGDILNLSPNEILEELPKQPDVIVGGPPCQGFSRIGRAKQRSLLDLDEQIRFGGVRNPGRNELYREFLKVVQVARPKAFVMENVPAMRELIGADLAGRIAREASHLGYNVRYFLLNAVWFGVPQHRWRIFFVGLRSDLGTDCIPRPPKRTHRYGALSPEGVAIPEDPWMLWRDQIPQVASLKPGVTVREAISDLPRLTGHLDGVRPGERPLPLRRKPSKWAALMRNWPGREANGDVKGNWYRYTPRDFSIFREMAHGDRYPQALSIANRLLKDDLELRHKEGDPIKPGSARYQQLRKQIIPPYRNDAFDDKWRKLIPDKPSWTLTAHLSRDTYSHIHYQSAQARTITVREAARLQSFPDSFEFSGNFGDQYRQVGNAVPPLMARAIAEQLFEQLRELEAATDSF